MKKKKNYGLRVRALVVFATVLISGITAVMLFSPLFDVSEAYCEGNVRLSDEELIETSQIVHGKNILTQSLRKIRRNISSLPMVEEVSVKRVFPDKIKIIVKERVPAAYMEFGGAIAVADVDGRILEIISDERADVIRKTNTPVSAVQDNDLTEKNEDKSGDKNNGQENNTGEEAASNNKDGTVAEDDTTADKMEQFNPYNVPLIAGLELTKAETGRIAESNADEKLKTVLGLLNSLEKVGLLSGATYINVNDLSDVTLFIENRLEIQLGVLENIDYRCAFLSKVINEKLSETEHAIMDYRTDDIYVRQPDDGKARMEPKQSTVPETKKSDREDEGDEDDGDETNGTENASSEDDE